VSWSAANWRASLFVDPTLAEPGGGNNLEKGLVGELGNRPAKPLIFPVTRAIARGQRLGEVSRNTRSAFRLFNYSRKGCATLEAGMTTFDDRQKGFEKKFAHDAELKFKAESRRNKMLAEWAGAKLGLSAAELEDYIKAVRRADLEEKGDDDVLRKVKGDLDAKSLGVTEAEIREAMSEFLAKAVTEIEGKKS
jgi:hypothetical protein